MGKPCLDLQLFRIGKAKVGNIGKYLSRIRKFDQVIAPQEGFRAQL